MTHGPRSTDEIYESLKDSLSGKIAKLTNFTDKSFNYIWARAFSRKIREVEVKATVSELAGWIDYTGGDVTDDDLEDLGISGEISAEEVNEFMDDQYLDEFVKILGISRLPGSRATGSVTFTTESDETTIEKGTPVSTAQDATGGTLEFLTTEEVTTADGVTTVTDVGIQADEIGDEYNIPANTIVRLVDPPVGVRSVTNPNATTGGTVRESNEDLRERAKKAVQSSSLGGTTDGIKGYIRQNIEGVGTGDVIIDEFKDESPIYVDVIVDGGIESNVIDAIEFSRPTGVRHNLVRPEIVQLGFDVDLLGSDIDIANVTNNIENFLLESGIDENVYRDTLIAEILSSDDGIVNVDDIGGIIERVTNETFTYQNGTSDYDLDYTYESTNGSITITDDSGAEYDEGSDFEVQDQSGDGWPETVVWIGNTPDDEEKFFVDYDVTVSGTTTDEYTTDLVRDEKFVWNEGYQESFEYETGNNLYELEFVPFDNSSSITDASGDTYAEGTDYDIIDDSGNGFIQTIDWSTGGGTPDNTENFTITYNQKLYHTVYEHRDTPSGEISDGSGDTYTEGAEYQRVDYNNDGEQDAIEWLSNPSSLNDGEEFYFTYLTEGDVFFDIRSKADPGTIDVRSN